MSFLNVFLASLTLTAVIGAFLARTWQVTGKPRALASFCGFALLVHLAWLAVPQLGHFAPAARWLAIFWLGSMLAGLVLMLPFALLTALATRRRLKSMSIYLPVAFVSCFLISGIILSVTSTANFVVRQEEVRIHNLPADLDGFRIANLGDVHIGRFIDPIELARGIQAINEQKVNLLVITGDLVDDLTQLEDAMRVLERSNTAEKIVAVLGNHEAMGDLPKILAIYAQHSARIDLLTNQNIRIIRGATTLHIVGVDYPMNPRGGHMRPAPEQNAAMSIKAEAAFAGIDKGAMILALSHHPAFFPIAAEHGAQLTLASHTHGGQLRWFGYPVINAYPFLQGLYRHGDSYLDVSAGFGHWFPIRFGVPREIVIVTLRSEQTTAR